MTKITQGAQESFSDFVARMKEAAGRIFGYPEAAMPSIEQLVYEQAMQECRSAITPRKSKGLQDWLKVCVSLEGRLLMLDWQPPFCRGSGARTQRSSNFALIVANQDI